MDYDGLVERLLKWADIGDMGRGPSDDDLRRQAAEAITTLQARLDELSVIRLENALALVSAQERADRWKAIAGEMARSLEPFAKAAMGVEGFDPDFPMEGAALRASFDWYDKVQSEPLKRHSVRRSDLDAARQSLSRYKEMSDEN